MYVFWSILTGLSPINFFNICYESNPDNRYLTISLLKILPNIKPYPSRITKHLTNFVILQETTYSTLSQFGQEFWRKLWHKRINFTCPIFYMAMFKIPHVLEMDQVYLKLELQEIVFELNIAYAIIIFFLFIAGHCIALRYLFLYNILILFSTKI